MTKRPVGDDPIFDKLSRLLIEAMHASLDERLTRVMTDDGKLRLGKRTTTGTVPSERGGWRDHAHDGADAQQLDEANTHQNLDLDAATRIHWTREAIQDMLATGFLLAGDGVTLTYDDVANTLTISATGTSEMLYWDGTPITWDGDGLHWG